MTSYSGILHGKKFDFIAVDNFKISSVQRASAIFVSHYHTDHFKELLNEGVGREIHTIFNHHPEKKVYCSQITKRLFESDTYKRPYIPKEQIISIPVGQPYMIEKPKQHESENSVVVTVTLIPSGHIFGGVMFMFEHELDEILFTGDFRIYHSDLEKINHFHNRQGNVKKISDLYLDCTFARPEYMKFPLRSEATHKFVELASEWLLLSPDHQVAVDIPYNFAYEYFMIKVSKLLKCKIGIYSEYYRNYYQYIPELDDVLLTENWRKNVRVHMCYRSKKDGRCDFCCSSRYGCLKTIRLCASTFKDYNLNRNIVMYESPFGDRKIRVAYSTHCSLEELQAFVKYFNPGKIYPISTDNEISVETLDLLRSESTKKSVNSSELHSESNLITYRFDEIHSDSDSDDGDGHCTKFHMPSPPR